MELDRLWTTDGREKVNTVDLFGNLCGNIPEIPFYQYKALDLTVS